PPVLTAAVLSVSNVATLFNTLQSGSGNSGNANSTGYVNTTSGSSTQISSTTFNYANVASAAAGGVPSTIPRVIQNSGASASATVSVQQQPIPVFTAAAPPITTSSAVLNNQLGGGLLRNFQSVGPAVTTFLNSSGATTGTQIEINVSKMPAGSSVT